MDQIPAKRPLGVCAWIILLVLLGLGALAGGGALLLASDGSLLRMPVSMLAGTLFRDHLIPGALLFTFLGVYPLAAAFGLWRRPAWAWAESLNPVKVSHWSWAGATGAGIIVIAWITVQIRLVGYVHPVQFLYLVWGFAIAALGAVPNVRGYCARERQWAGLRRPATTLQEDP